MIDKKFKAVFWDFGGVITSSPFQAFSSFENENNLPKDLLSIKAVKPGSRNF